MIKRTINVDIDICSLWQSWVLPHDFYRRIVEIWTSSKSELPVEQIFERLIPKEISKPINEFILQDEFFYFYENGIIKGETIDANKISFYILIDEVRITDNFKVKELEIGD